MKKQEKTKKRGKILFPVIIVAFLFLMMSGGDDGDKGNNSTQNTQQTESQISNDGSNEMETESEIFNETSSETETETQYTSRFDYSTIDEYLNVLTDGVSENSTSMVDAIALIAKFNAQDVTSNEISNAISFIYNTYPNYFVDNMTMEKTMYYGYLLDYAFDDSDIRSSLGTDATQVVKYVYRNVETVEDHATQENLSQIREALDELYNH